MTQEAIQTPVLKEHEESMRGKRKQVGKLATGSTLLTNPLTATQVTNQQIFENFDKYKCEITDDEDWQPLEI
jgi:hypothetical protein